ncbi:tetratricopeptide repeat protein [Marinobacter sp. NSM]|uniref:tetratricopeptide repeat protein n=1 Tax=Marinobacter sp. NSM TaxID=3458004 RepID=UPI0040364ED2
MKYWNAIARPVLAVTLTTFLAGCAAMQAEEDGHADTASSNDSLPIVCSNNVTPEQQVELDAIDDLMARSENYAALARLETLSFSTQQHWLRWAELMAKVEQSAQAEDAFEQIAQACGSAAAYHGLGVVYLKTNRVQEGLGSLQQAKNQDPASASIRNDFGIALMRGGLFGQAAFELRTAYELSGRQQSVARSMVAAYYLRGGDQMVEQLQRETGLSDQAIDAGIEFSRQFTAQS